MGIRAFVKKQNESLHIEPIDLAFANLPPELDGFRIAVLSDLHMKSITDYHDRVLHAVRDIRPDCIVIPGDTIDQKTGLIENLTPFFRALSAIAPTIAILGNNDCHPGRIDTLRNMYRTAGVTLLENETRLLNARGFPLRITGLMDPLADQRNIAPFRPQPETEQVRVPLKEILPSEKNRIEGFFLPSILLIHRPELVEHYTSLRPSIAIAGHAHGGQFRLPRRGGLYAPDQGFFPKLTSGLYRLNDTNLIVSRGIGNHVLYLRLNNPPHIPVIVLRRQ